ncbi:hypothetical protein C5167_016562 [Papaver somniferum]|nr:hypothetical protein C5167_016562 [Papaver somniferum]
MAEVQIGKTYPVKSRLKPKSKKPTSITEPKYWKNSYKTTQIPNLIYPITSIDFSPLTNDFITTYSASATLCSSQTLEPTSKFTSFNDIAYSASYRHDGKLVAFGGESGDYPKFGNLHLFSGGDDTFVKYWDVASETELLSFQGHKDYVSSMNSTMNINHGKPVEDVIFLPFGSLLATAGGNSVKIWDVTSGGKLVYAMENHNKTVTSLCVGKILKDGSSKSDESRLLSVGLDGDSSVRVIGTSNGVISAGKKKKKDVDGVSGKELGEYSISSAGEVPEKRALRPTNFRYFQRSQSEKPPRGDYLIKRRAKLKSPNDMVAVMEDLVARKKLLKCVSNLDEDELGLLLNVLHKYSTMPRYAGFLIGLTKRVVQMRAEDIKSSDTLKGHVWNIKRSVVEEISIQNSLLEIQGIISPLLRSAEKAFGN